MQPLPHWEHYLLFSEKFLKLNNLTQGYRSQEQRLAERLKNQEENKTDGMSM